MERKEALDKIGNFSLRGGDDDTRSKQEMLQSLNAALERASQRRIGDFSATATAFKGAHDRRMAEEAAAAGGAAAGQAASDAAARSRELAMEEQYKKDLARKQGQAMGEASGKALEQAKAQGALQDKEDEAFSKNVDQFADEYVSRKKMAREAEIAKELEKVQAESGKRNAQLEGQMGAPYPVVTQPSAQGAQGAPVPTMAELEQLQRSATPQGGPAPMPTPAQPGAQGQPAAGMDPQMEAAFQQYLARIGAAPAASMPQLRQPAMPVAAPEPFPGYSQGLQAYFANGGR